MAGIPLSAGVEVTQQNSPEISKYFNGNVPWTDTTQVNNGIPSTKRHLGLTVNISGTEYWYKLGIANTDLVEKQNGSAPAVTVEDVLTSTSSVNALSANQGRLLKQYIDNINSILTSDDTTLDELQEVVDFIKANKSTLDSLGIANIAGLQTALDNKVTAEAGKGLSTNDYDNTEKQKVTDSEAHRNDANVHVTAGEKVLWNDKADKQQKIVLTPVANVDRHTLTIPALNRLDTIFRVNIIDNVDNETDIVFTPFTGEKYFTIELVDINATPDHVIKLVAPDGNTSFVNMVSDASLISTGITLFAGNIAFTNRLHVITFRVFYEDSKYYVFVDYENEKAFG